MHLCHDTITVDGSGGCYVFIVLGGDDTSQMQKTLTSKFSLLAKDCTNPSLCHQFLHFPTEKQFSLKLAVCVSFGMGCLPPLPP